MNAKQIITAVSIAFAASAALATEATEFADAASTLTRTEVKAAVAQAKRDGTLFSGGEATVFVDRPVAAARTREDVRAEARIAARSHAFNALYIGS